MKIFLALLIIHLLFIGCSNNFDDNEPILIMTVEPSYLDINNMSSYITVIIKDNSPSNNWVLPEIEYYSQVIPVAFAIEFYDNNEWIEVYNSLEYGFGRPMLIRIDKPLLWTIAMRPCPYHSHYFNASVIGRYRVILTSLRHINEWYAKFKILG